MLSVGPPPQATERAPCPKACPSTSAKPGLCPARLGQATAGEGRHCLSLPSRGAFPQNTSLPTPPARLLTLRQRRSGRISCHVVQSGSQVGLSPSELGSEASLRPGTPDGQSSYGRAQRQGPEMSLPWDLPRLQPMAHICYHCSDFTELFIDISLGVGPQLTLHGETNSDPKVRTGKLG